MTPSLQWSTEAERGGERAGQSRSPSWDRQLTLGQRRRAETGRGCGKRGAHQVDRGAGRKKNGKRGLGECRRCFRSAEGDEATRRIRSQTRPRDVGDVGQNDQTIWTRPGAYRGRLPLAAPVLSGLFSLVFHLRASLWTPLNPRLAGSAPFSLFIFIRVETLRGLISLCFYAALRSRSPHDAPDDLEPGEHSYMANDMSGRLARRRSPVVGNYRKRLGISFTNQFLLNLFFSPIFHFVFYYFVMCYYFIF